jgi:phosphatidylglycerophosphate synthase
MLDGPMRRLIDPVLDGWGMRLAARGWSANRVTLVGLALGLAAALVLALGGPGWGAMVPLLASRLADGLDGAVARATRKTDFGGFLDILCDFVFYGAVVLAFVLRDPAANAVAGAVLLLSFYANGSSFLAYAILAAKRGLETTDQGEKSLYFSPGLLGGTETIGFFVLLCLWPAWFAPLAWIFATLCFYTCISRVWLAWKVFG